MKNIFKKSLLIVLIITSAFIVFWVGSLIKCEILTNKYYDDFEYASTNTTILGEIEYFKVLNCDNKKAEIYYVSKGMTGGDVLTFEKENDIWTQTNWETVWSTTGSASSVIYPYWWHFIYSGL